MEGWNRTAQDARTREADADDAPMPLPLNDELRELWCVMPPGSVYRVYYSVAAVASRGMGSAVPKVTPTLTLSHPLGEICVS